MRCQKMTIQKFKHATQQGLALLSALLILLIIAMIGVAVGTGGRSMQKTVTSHEDLGNALAAAEATLRVAERALWVNVINGAPAVDPDCSPAPSCVVGGFDVDNNWWQSEAVWAGQLTLGAGPLYAPGQPLADFNVPMEAMALAAQPQFRIEASKDPTQMRKLTAEEGSSGLRLHQITVRSRGRGEAEIVVQSVYGIMVE